MQDTSFKALEVLVGTWQISGDAVGIVKYSVLEGSHFMTQEVTLEYGGRKIQGIELIGRLHPVDGEPSKDIHSRFYSTLDGLTLDYVYEVQGKTFRIWFGPRDSDNFMTSEFAPDYSSYTGSWKWPGGGYSFIGRRIS